MKTKQLCFLFTFALSITACGDDEPIYTHGNSKSTSIGDNQGANSNKNTTGPVEAQNRYEFPKLKGGTNVVIVHKAKLNDKVGLEGVNYCVEWDSSIHAQRWSCYQLYNTVNYKSGDIVSRYSADNDGSLSSYCQYPNDLDLAESFRLTADPYKYNNFDHGHICPSADRQRSTEANYQTFFITNMQPQYMNFNGSNRDGAINQRSPWYRLEGKIRDWVKMSSTGSGYDTLYVCKGGTIDKSEYILQYLTDKINRKNIIPVPKYFFVAVFGKKETTYSAIGFWMEHVSQYDVQKPLSEYACNIDKLEEYTGIDFFCNLPDEIEDAVEKSYSASDWAGNLQ